MKAPAAGGGAAIGGDGKVARPRGDVGRRWAATWRLGLYQSITDSACKNQLVVVGIQYGHFNTYIPIRSTTIGKSRVARDPITMHTSWRSNSDITSVTRQTHLPKTHPVLRPEIYHTIITSDSIGYPRMKASGESSTTKHRLLHASGPYPIPPPNGPKTNQYNQDLGLIHSTNGNHLESPNEGSSIDHQVTIHLHAQNITMFPTKETCTLYQMLNKQLHLLLPTHEMWELPTPLIAANKPSREKRDTGVTRSASEAYENYPLVLKHSILGPKHRKQQLGVTNSTSANPSSLTQQKALNKAQRQELYLPNKLGAKSDAYAYRLHNGDVFAHLTSFKKTFESNIQTKRLSNRSPTLPLLLQSDLSTVDNRRR
ncbi:hypothetical protein F511_20081 [Dorcoceras hygrometricum]|uniref:Uncharacterized protein n=1 Tax=Dorcoceras hygrometricum TaxID=472368 RepID=A0A2Z7BNF7_9LAMI|nr:hypothetical protein F511_20081 [Dorcoceras hygrometricum]